MPSHKVIVLGSGVAGMIAAWQLHRLGFNVTIFTKSCPSQHQLQTVHKSILSTLDFLNLSDIAEQFFKAPAKTNLKWGPDVIDTQDKEQSFLFNRQDFDKALLDTLQKARIKINTNQKGFQCINTPDKNWSVINNDTQEAMQADFIVNATGKHFADYKNIIHQGEQTLALRFSWTHSAHKESNNSMFLATGDDYWCWAASLDQLTNVSIFIDPKTLADKYNGKSGRLFNDVKTQQSFFNLLPRTHDYDVVAMNARPYYLNKTIDNNLIHVGDSVIKNDPLSSQGIQGAISSAIQAVVCINSILNTPKYSGYANTFYTDRIIQRAAHQAQFSAASYHQVALENPNAFWLSRSALYAPKQADIIKNTCARFNPNIHYRLSSDTKITQVPYIDDSFIKTCEAIEHPLLDAPITFPKNGVMSRCLVDLKNKTFNEITQHETLNPSQINELQQLMCSLTQVGAIQPTA